MGRGQAAATSKKEKTKVVRTGQKTKPIRDSEKRKNKDKLKKKGELKEMVSTVYVEIE